LVFGGAEFLGTGFLGGGFGGTGGASCAGGAEGGGGCGGGLSFSYILVSCCEPATSSLFALLRTKKTIANAARRTIPTAEPTTIPAIAPELNLLEELVETGSFEAVAAAAAECEVD
jgi:hypothetical protein